MADPSSAPPAKAVPARLASTVLLVRDGARGVEVFMERRHIASDFVGGAYVFPGGRVDPEDRIPEALCRGLSEAEANRRLGVERGGLAFFAAAIRECFEEAGVLLAYDREGELLDCHRPDREQRFAKARAALNASEVQLLEIVEREGLVLATDRVHYWSHWITPEGQPRRYDTRFFIARVPAGQTAAHDDWELTHSAWVSPQEAIERAVDGRWTMILPTLRNLQQLAEHPNVESALAWAALEREHPVMQPRILGDRVVLPGDPGYDEAPRDTSAADPAVWAGNFRRQAQRGIDP